MKTELRLRLHATQAQSCFPAAPPRRIVDEEAYAPEGDTRYIVVENSLKTLQQLANYHRQIGRAHV